MMISSVWDHPLRFLSSGTEKITCSMSIHLIHIEINIRHFKALYTHCITKSWERMRMRTRKNRFQSQNEEIYGFSSEKAIVCQTLKRLNWRSLNINSNLMFSTVRFFTLFLLSLFHSFFLSFFSQIHLFGLKWWATIQIYLWVCLWTVFLCLLCCCWCCSFFCSQI